MVCMKKKRASTKPKAGEFSRKAWPRNAHRTEQSLDSVALNKDLSEAFRDTTPHDMDSSLNTANWSSAEDRGEDLINERDPFMQQPERDTEIPPELVQDRPYHLYEQQGGDAEGNMSDWFETERRRRGEQLS